MEKLLGNIGNIWRNYWEILGTYGETIGTYWEHMAKLLGHIGNTWRNYWEILGTYGETIGKYWEHTGKLLGNIGNIWRNYWEILGTYGETIGKYWEHMGKLLGKVPRSLRTNFLRSLTPKMTPTHFRHHLRRKTSDYLYLNSRAMLLRLLRDWYEPWFFKGQFVGYIGSDQSVQWGDKSATSTFWKVRWCNIGAVECAHMAQWSHMTGTNDCKKFIRTMLLTDKVHHDSWLSGFHLANMFFSVRSVQVQSMV